MATEGGVMQFLIQVFDLLKPRFLQPIHLKCMKPGDSAMESPGFMHFKWIGCREPWF